MSVYMTEEEQLEQIKKWWKQFGNIITISLSIVLLCVAGYRYMNWHHTKQTQQASIIYENMMVALSNQNNKSVRSYANELIKDYSSSVYADVAHMTLAKLDVSKNKLVHARKELSYVIQKSKMNALKQIARIRTARIFLADKAYSNALSELGTIADNTYLPVINELKGDIYNAQGNYKEAIAAYRMAIDEVKTNGMGNLFLEMKTNELAMKTQSTISNTKKNESV